MKKKKLKKIIKNLDERIKVLESKTVVSSTVEVSGEKTSLLYVGMQFYIEGYPGLLNGNYQVCSLYRELVIRSIPEGVKYFLDYDKFNAKTVTIKYNNLHGQPQ